MLGIVYSFLEKIGRDKMIEVRETCPHWINYAVYDSLPADLKDEYVQQFALPYVLLKPHEKRVVVECCCLHQRVDCTKHFSKTCEYMLSKWEDMLNYAHYGEAENP